MKQAAFLRRLKYLLIWRLPGAQVRSVLEDYGGFFADRMADGKTEEEVCQEFGSPQTIARNILREEERNTRPLGLLALAWTALTWYLNWWFTWEHGLFRGHPVPLCALNLLLVPALWWCWRKELTSDAPLSRGSAALRWGLSTAAWGAVFGFYLWAFFAFLPRWQALSLEQRASANLGYAFGWAYDIARWAILLLVLALLLRTWWEGSPRRLPAAAWCTGCLSSLNCMLSSLRSMDIEAYWTAEEMGRITSLGTVAVLLAVGGGGAALTAFLVWKGGRGHGRAA